MANYLIQASYDSSKFDLPTITCSISTENSMALSVCYTGEKATELLKILTQQGYLEELLKKKEEKEENKEINKINDSIAKLAELADECPCYSRCTDTEIMSCASKCDYYRDWLRKIKEV